MPGQYELNEGRVTQNLGSSGSILQPDVAILYRLYGYKDGKVLLQ